MIYINEWLPNPAGADASGEWVELWNSGNAPADITGWKLETKGGSKTTLTGKVSGKGYLVFERNNTKLVLKNTDEGIFLYDAKGDLIDQSIFMGSAPEGKSFSRLARHSFSDGGSEGQSFTWSDPTPGAQNKISIVVSTAKENYENGTTFNHAIGATEVVLLAIGTAVVIVAAALVVIKRNEGLHKLFFG